MCRYISVVCAVNAGSLQRILLVFFSLQSSVVDPLARWSVGCGVCTFFAVVNKLCIAFSALRLFAETVAAFLTEHARSWAKTDAVVQGGPKS